MRLPGLEELWAETLGHPEVCVALLDGPVDVLHPSLRCARLEQHETLTPGTADDGMASQHGTQIASILFGRHDGPVKGLAPGCRGISLPIFGSGPSRSSRRCSQVDLARAIGRAMELGAAVINVSGGEFSPTGDAGPILEAAVRACGRQDVLLVAAAGNEGCRCLHVPAALNGVLAVGAMNDRGEALPLSNWGDLYRESGILAPGEAILVAGPGGGAVRRSGTSYAAAVVSGVAALLLSLQAKRGRRTSPGAVRDALLKSALGCDYQRVEDCRRLLAGRLNISGARSFIMQGSTTMLEASSTSETAVAPGAGESSATPAAASSAVSAAPTGAMQPGVQASGCGCTCGAKPQLVYALGQLGYDLVSEARLDSLVQKMAGQFGVSTPERVLAFDANRFLSYLDQNPWDAAAVEWTLNLDGTPIYAIRPEGAFAGETFSQLRRFLRERSTEGVERVSIPGKIVGKATLLMGQVVPIIVPDLRGMYSWTTSALVSAVVGPSPAAEAPAHEKHAHAQRHTGVRNFLDRVYHELRNLGAAPHDRAINFAASNAFEIEKVYESAIKEQMELESINVSPSPICRPGSDCWDVEVYFFYPERQVQTVRKVYRFAVDVSDIVPVTVGPMRSWFTR